MPEQLLLKEQFEEQFDHVYFIYHLAITFDNTSLKSGPSCSKRG